MRTLLMTTAVALTLAAPAAYAQISTSGSAGGTTAVGGATAKGSAGINSGTINVGNTPSTVRVDGNSTVRTYGDGTSTITRPANDAMDNTRLGTEVNTRVESSKRVTPPEVSTQRVYDGATGVTRSVTGTTSGAMGSVVDTVKSPLGANATVRSNTGVSVGN